MPLTFPSHQGLILPLWRKWPHLVNGLALCVGAAMPDVVDVTVAAWRGSLGQLYGHSLVGLFLFCLPGGLVLTWLIDLFGKWAAKFRSSPRPLERTIGRIGYYIERLNYTPDRIARSGKKDLILIISVGVGTFSHLFFDFISHGRFIWLYPWYVKEEVFPAFWYWKWGSIPYPLDQGLYELRTYTLVWILLTIVGAVMFFRILIKNRK